MIMHICKPVTMSVQYRYLHTIFSTGLPSAEVLNRVVTGSFHNVDSNDNGFIERFEFDTLVIVADSDGKLCTHKAIIDIYNECGLLIHFIR